ncbi:MAG TPA: hypothetical protein VMB71_15255 [Acetobacteraceae bacterium]|nr:hypothetical protein [Acetobacteraceae bacterium]
MLRSVIVALVTGNARVVLRVVYLGFFAVGCILGLLGPALSSRSVARVARFCLFTSITIATIGLVFLTPVMLLRAWLGPTLNGPAPLSDDLRNLVLPWCVDAAWWIVVILIANRLRRWESAATATD